MPKDDEERTPVDKFRWLTSTDLKRPENMDQLLSAWDAMVGRYQDQRDKTLVILREDDVQRAETLAVLRDIQKGMKNGFPMPLWGKVNLALTAGLVVAVAILFFILFHARSMTATEHRGPMTSVVGENNDGLGPHHRRNG